MHTVFNTNRTTNSKAQIASAEYALITVGKRTELGQSVTGNYTRQIQTIFEIGTPNVMWLAGHEQGTLAFNRLVGGKGFFYGWDPDTCGEIRPVSINLGSGPCVSAARGGLKFGGAMVESVNFSIQAGTLEISEGISLRIATLSRA